MYQYERARAIAVTFAITAGGLLMLACTVPVLGIKNVQQATRLHLFADAHRMASLAKTYDAKAAAMAIMTLVKETK